MRTLLAVLMIGVAVPAYAGCRLSTTQCGVIAEEMRQAEIAEIVDRNSVKARYMADYDREVWIIRRSVARLQERASVLPPAIAKEYRRIVGCDAAEQAGNVTTAAYRKSCM